MTNSTKIIAVLLSATVLLGALSGCATRTVLADQPVLSFDGGPAPMTIPVKTITVVGDSISSGPVLWGTAHTMWDYQLAGPVVVDHTQGWTKGGARLRDMAAAMHPVPANEVLVIEGGTNDGGPATMGLPCVAPCGTSRAEMASELATIMQKSGLPMGDIYVSAAAPLNSDVGNGSMAWWNSEEQLLCAQLGCHYFDLFDGLRQPDGGPYYINFTFDGIHPTDYAASIMAKNAVEEITGVTG